MKRVLIILIFLFQGLTLFCQGRDAFDISSEHVSIFGKVVTADSLSPIRNTHVISKMAHCGTISNRDGIFFIPAEQIDTLWVSCIGYARRLIPIDSTFNTIDTLIVKLSYDTITIKEVVIKPYYDYATFKEMVISMPTMPTPREISKLNEEINEMQGGKKTDPYFNIKNGGITASPLQYLYDTYNKSARMKKRILRNRRLYNDVMREQGRLDELLPDSLEFEVEYRIYELPEDQNDSIAN